MSPEHSCRSSQELQYSNRALSLAMERSLRSSTIQLDQMITAKYNSTQLELTLHPPYSRLRMSSCLPDNIPRTIAEQ